MQSIILYVCTVLQCSTAKKVIVQQIFNTYHTTHDKHALLWSGESLVQSLLKKNTCSIKLLLDAEKSTTFDC